MSRKIRPSQMSLKFEKRSEARRVLQMVSFNPGSTAYITNCRSARRRTELPASSGICLKLHNLLYHRDILCLSVWRI